MDIFRGICPTFFRDRYLFSEPNNCFKRAAQGQLLFCNGGNTVTVLKTSVKTHRDQKEADSFAKSCSSEKLL